MSTVWTHNEYYRRRLDDSTFYTFTGIEDAKTKMALHNTYLNTANPSISYTLQDSDQTVKVTLSFASEADQTTWKTAVDQLGDDSTAWHAGDIEWYKIEWLHPDGSVSDTANF